MTVSAVKPIVHCITTEVLVAKEGDTDLTKEIKEWIKVDLEMRYSDPNINQLLAIASFLDPWFKLGYVGGRENVLAEVKEQLVEVISNNGTENPNDSSSDNPPAAKKAKGLSKILGKHLGSTASIGLTPQEKIKPKLDCYLSHPQLEMEENLLNWWKAEHTRYPHLAKLAQKYLCICATSVPSERVFSYAGQTVSDRSALKPK